MLALMMLGAQKMADLVSDDQAIKMRSAGVQSSDKMDVAYMSDAIHAGKLTAGKANDQLAGPGRDGGIQVPQKCGHGVSVGVP